MISEREILDLCKEVRKDRLLIFELMSILQEKEIFTEEDTIRVGRLLDDPQVEAEINRIDSYKEGEL